MKPWENEDGSTNVDGFLAAYAADDNTFWRAEQGHILNVLDELIDRLDFYELAASAPDEVNEAPECSVRAFEGAAIHDNPQVFQCPECGMGRAPDEVNEAQTIAGDTP